MKSLIELLPPQIQHKAKEIQKHQRILDAALNQSNLSGCIAGGVAGSTLTVLCQTAAQASTVRYMEGQIVTAFEDYCPGLITRIHVRMKTGDSRVEAEKPEQPSVKQQSAQEQEYKRRLRETLKKIGE